jgi:hypothetical protein
MPTHSIAGRSQETRPPVRLSFVRWTALSTAALAFLAIGVYVGAKQLGATLRLAGASTDPSPMALMIGDTRFGFPANTIRFPEQRTAQAQSELDLYLAWPDLSGFTEASAGIFRDPEAKSLLFARLSSADRKEREVEGTAPDLPALPGPAGLTQVRRPGLPGIAFEEIVYHGAKERVPPYEASCLGGADPVMAADCIREIKVEGGLRLRYRFSHALLPAWNEIDRAVLRYISEHRRT